MTNALATLPTGGVPAAFANRAGLPDMNKAAQAGIQAGFAVIGYKGRNWRLKYRGDDTLLKDPRGNPVATLDVVVVGVSEGVSKIWYEKKYTEGDDQAPDCFSIDGIAPDAASPKRQHETCATCPQNIWGSRLTEAGKKAKACQDSRRIAVVPYGDIENAAYGGPMMLRIPPMSLAGFANFARECSRFSAQLYQVRTTLGFDYDVAYPLLTFTPAGWITDDEPASQVIEAMQNPLIERMLSAETVEALHDPASASPLTVGAPATAFAKSAPAAEPKPAPAQIAAPVEAKAPAKPKAPAAPAVAAPAVSEAVVEDEESALQRQLDAARARKAAKAAAATQAAPEPAVQAAPASAQAEAPITPQPAPSDLESVIEGILNLS